MAQSLSSEENKQDLDQNKDSVDNEKDLNRQSLAEITKIIKEIKQSPAMNGSFNKLYGMVQDIQKEQQEIVVGHKEIQYKIRDLHDAVYDPEHGIKEKLSDVLIINKLNEQAINSLKETSEEQEEQLEEHTETIESLVNLKETIEEIGGGERLQNLEGLIKLNIWGKKGVGLFIAGLIGVVASEYGKTIIMKIISLFS